MIRTKHSSVARVTLSFRAPARLGVVVFILVQAGCNADKSVDPAINPPVEPAVATSLASNTTATLSANAGLAVLPPSVIVKDQRGAAMEGVAVTFEVASGGGTISGGSAATNSAGIATVGSWKLGATPGLNSLTASVTGLPSLTFTAMGIQDPLVCARAPAVVAHAFGTTTNGALDLADCLSDAVYTDFYSTTLSAEGAYVFKVSATFDTYLYLGTSNWLNSFEAGLIGANNNESGGTTNSAIKALLPAGSYVLGVTSWNWGEMGAYSLSSETASPEVSGCEEIYVVRGVSTTQNVLTTDCLRTNGPTYADQYLIYLEAGRNVNLSMSSAAVDSFLELFLVDPITGVRTPVASNDNVDTSGTKDAKLSYTPTVSATYVILASTTLDGQTGAYTLAIY
jgi:hypothetical protein